MFTVTITLNSQELGHSW
uniref:Uncharacterized protein n=1 Tax=Anguilla anguilla TaxID=7936 RepID=A0A0E9SYN3_ANGAN